MAGMGFISQARPESIIPVRYVDVDTDSVKWADGTFSLAILLASSVGTYMA